MNAYREQVGLVPFELKVTADGKDHTFKGEGCVEVYTDVDPLPMYDMGFTHLVNATAMKTRFNIENYGEMTHIVADHVEEKELPETKKVRADEIRENDEVVFLGETYKVDHALTYSFTKKRNIVMHRLGNNEQVPETVDLDDLGPGFIFHRVEKGLVRSIATDRTIKFQKFAGNIEIYWPDKSDLTMVVRPDDLKAAVNAL